MKRFKKFFAPLLVALSVAHPTAQSQTFDLRFLQVFANEVMCDVKIQINSNTSTFNLGTSSLVFNYPVTELINPVVQTAHNYSGGNYLGMGINTSTPGRVSVNIELGVPPGSAVPLAVMDVVTIRFTRIASPTVPTLLWVTGGGAPTVVFKDDEATVVPADSLINLNCCPLPVQISRFIATGVNGSSVRLEWTTIGEINNYGFFVGRRRASDTSFTEIPNSFLPGHGTTNEPHNYTFTDQLPGAPTVWYRLRQVDLDGSVHFTDPIQASGITSVEGNEAAPIEFALKQNYPNPFNPSTIIKFSVETTDRATIEVYNIHGQRVAMLFDGVAEAGQYYKIKFDATNLASGMYVYRLHAGKRSDMRKLLLLK